MRPSAMSRSDQDLQALPGNLAAHRVEGCNRNGLRCVVDDEIDTGDRLEGPDVPTLTADDPAFHVVAGQRHDRHRRLGDDFRRQTLDRRRKDASRPLVGLFTRPNLEIAHQEHRISPGLVFDFGQELLLRCSRVDPCKTFEVLSHLFPHHLGLLTDTGHLALTLEQELFARRQVRSPLFECLFALGESGFDRVDLDLAVFERSLFTFAVALGPGSALLLCPGENPLCFETRLGDRILRIGVPFRRPGESRSDEEPSPAGDHHGQRHRHRDGCC